MSERDLRQRPQHPFGPRQPGVCGGLLRLSQWELTVITAVCIWPGAMLLLTALTSLIPLNEGWRMPEASTLLIYGTWCLWAALLVLTALRLSYGWFRWWAVVPVVANYAVLASRVMPDAADSLGLCIWQLMIGVTFLQSLFHTLWSLCGKTYSKTEESPNEQEA